MNILSALRKKHETKRNQQLHSFWEKKQLNTTVNTIIIHKVGKLAAEFAVPRYAITEHLLEIGYFYVSRVLKNRKKREIIREHLIDMHILDGGYEDPEELLRIGEGRYASGLISLANNVVRDFRVLERLLPDAKRTGKFDNFEKVRKKLLRSALTLADWLSTHPLEEPDPEEIEDE